MTTINLHCKIVNKNTREEKEGIVKVITNSFISLCVGVYILNTNHSDVEIYPNDQEMTKLNKLEDFGYFNICLN